MEGLVDGWNRAVAVDAAVREYESARTAYQDAGGREPFVIAEGNKSRSAALWLKEQVRGQ
jgi:hypothetical protein